MHVCVDSLEKDINDTMRNHYLPTSESESWTASLFASLSMPPPMPIVRALAARLVHADVPKQERH